MAKRQVDSLRLISRPLTARDAVVIGLKLLAIIAAIELGIMILFAYTHFERWGAPWLVSLSDALILSILSSGFIYLWVFRPIYGEARRNSLFAVVLDQLKIGILITGNLQADNPIIYVNPAFLQITGYDEDDVLGKNPRFLKGPESLVEVAQKVSESIRDQRSVEAIQKNYRKDGSPYWNEMKICPVLDAQGRAIGFVELSTDVTQRVEMEQRSRELAQAVQQAGEAIVVVKREGAIEFANPAFCHHSGYTLSELQAQDGPRCLGVGDKSLFPSNARETLEAGRVWIGRHNFPCKDGSSFDCLSSISPIRNSEGIITHYVGVHRDITELVSLEKRLIQAKKMEAIGTLAGGIAHDFNNILADILGNIYMALREMDGDTKVASRLKAIEEQGYRAADTIRQLLTFARQGKLILVPITLNVHLKEIMQKLAPRMPPAIDVSFKRPAEPLIIRGDDGLLQQAIVNLVNNALVAVVGCEHPRIEVSLEELRNTSPSIDRVYPEVGWPDCERFACIRVRDNGPGMDKETLERVFEPFLTPKASSRGTGLEMAMVKGCVEMHMGHISCISEPGQGTEFTIILPCSDYVRPRGWRDENILPARGETILLVDRDDERRKMVKGTLVGMGYAVLATDNVKEAEHICNRVSQHLDLAIVDLDTPGLGEDAAVYIRSSIPEIPLLFMTGHEDMHTLGKAWQDDNAALLRNRPFCPEVLNRMLRTMIGPKMP